MQGIAPGRLLRLVALAGWLCAHASAAADSVTLVAAEDATIAEQDPTSPQGAATDLKAGTTGPIAGTMRNRTLLRFDLASAIPSNAVVTSAALTLTVVQAPPTPDDLWFHLHKVAAGWSEASVTWTSRLSSSPAVPWSTPGGAAPLDFAASATQSTLVTGAGVFVFASNPELVADVQDWINQPARNHGWMLLCQLEDLERSVRKFGSSEAGNPTARPALTVEFTVSAPPPTLTVLPPADGQFQFDFNAEADTGYVVEYSDDLGATEWRELMAVAPLPAPHIRRVSDSLAGGLRFYRVRRR